MLQVMSKKEELSGRRKKFAQLKSNCLFDLSLQRYFVAVKKVSNKEWKVVELTEDNRQKIAAGLVTTLTNLHFDEMSCLNLR